MDEKNIEKEVFVKPGFIYFTAKSTSLYTVVGSGVVVTIYDTKRHYGGISHYLKPIRESSSKSNPVYACPSIVGLLNIFFDSGSESQDLEAHVYGGASNPYIDGYIDGLAESNVKVGLEILELKKINIVKKDIGGNLGRKIMFNTSTGDVVVANVDRIRTSDWYPVIKE